MAILKLILTTLALSLSVVGLLLYIFQEKLIFFPTVLQANYIFEFDQPFEELNIVAGHSKVNGLLFSNKSNHGIIIYFHGNAGALDSWGHLASEISHKMALDVLMVDYPGYGKSPGPIKSEMQLQHMADAVYLNVKNRFPNKKIIVYGRSLGSGVASYLASKKKIDGLILETPLYNAQALAKHLFPYVPSFLLRYRLASNEYLRGLNVPTLFVHGDRDEIVPYSQGQKLFEEYRGPKEFLSIASGRHNNLPEHAEYWTGLKRFLGQF